MCVEEEGMGKGKLGSLRGRMGHRDPCGWVRQYGHSQQKERMSGSRRWRYRHAHLAGLLHHGPTSGDHVLPHGLYWGHLFLTSKRKLLLYSQHSLTHQPILQFSVDTSRMSILVVLFWHYPELTQTPQVKGSVPQDCPHSDTSHKSQVATHTSDQLATNWGFQWPAPQVWLFASMAHRTQKNILLIFSSLL